MATTFSEMTARPAAPSRRIAALGLPLLLGALSASASGVIDTAMMGHYGTNALAAVAGGSAVFDLFASIVLAACLGHQILAPRFAGRNDPPGLLRSLRSSFAFCGAIAALLVLVCFVAGGPLVGLLSGNDPAIRHIGAGYLAARGATLLLLVPFTLLAATFNAYERPLIATVAAVVVNVVNLGLDALLIFGPGPFPRLGAVGNGLATTLAWAAGIVVLVVLGRRFAHVLAQPGPEEPPDFETSVPRLSWPAIVSSGVDYVSIAAFFAIVGTLGTAPLAGARVAFELMVLVFAAAASFAAGARILIGRSVGAADAEGSRVFWRTGQRLLLVPATGLALVLVAFPRPVSLVFTSFSSVNDAAAAAIPLVGLSLPLLAWSLGNDGVLRALGLTRLDMWSNLGPVVLVQLPLAWILAHPAHLGVRGAYLGVVGYWLSRALLTEVFARRAMARETELAPA
jgi:putative MATE family efflux protein